MIINSGGIVNEDLLKTLKRASGRGFPFAGGQVVPNGKFFNIIFDAID